MPHSRSRHLLSLLKNRIRHSAITGILGHRQVGKTTLLGEVAERYLTLDDEDTFKLAESGPKAFIGALSGKGVAIDECQLVPGLFPALKERVRTRPAPGQFILSGSVRFTSRKAIRESLTGRISLTELLPMDLAEIEGDPLPDLLPRLCQTPSLERFPWDQRRLAAAVLRRYEKSLASYLQAGGLPGVCFIRNPKSRSEKIKDQLLTILDRDIRLVYPTTLPLRQIEEYCRALARRQGEPLNHSDLRRLTGISEVTQKKLLFALEAVFVLRTIPLEGGPKGPAYFFEDQAEARYLAENEIPADQALQHAAYRLTRCSFHYREGEPAHAFQFRTRAGALVPVAFRTPHGTIGLITIDSADPSRSEKAAGERFLAHFSGSKILFLHPEKEIRAMGDRMAAIPLAMACAPS